jgi:putative DNA primase/helicase
LWKWLEEAQYEKEVKGVVELLPFEPTKYKIANVLEALKAVGHVAEGVQPPVWLTGDQTTPINAGEIVPLKNGILNLATRELRQHTPELFEHHVLPFDYDAKAPTPNRWLRFLDELWADDEETKTTLAEWAGYVISGDTSHQKMLLLVVQRSGKGTIGRVMTGLLGAHNVAAPTSPA